MELEEPFADDLPLPLADLPFFDGTTSGCLQLGHLTFLPANLLGAAMLLPQEQVTGMGILLFRCDEAKEYSGRGRIAKIHPARSLSKWQAMIGRI